MSNKYKVVIEISSILIIFLITIGISFAYFTVNLSGTEEETTIVVTGGSMNIYYNGGDDIEANSIVPSNNSFATKIFTVTGNNTLDINMGYEIKLIVEKNTFSEEALKYKLISTNADNNGLPVPTITNLTNIGTGPSSISLGVGYFDVPTDGSKVHTYNLELYFPESGLNQNEDQGKELSAYVTVVDFDYLTLAFDNEKGVNKPVLFSGMTPVKWNSSNIEIETTSDDPDWYDYNEKRWANAKTEDGSYWVWIPRYAYKITSGYHRNTTGTIDIKFLKSETIKTTDTTPVETEGYISGVKDTSMHYFLHPSFDVEGSELGFWVAKYESTAAEGVATVTSTCNIADNVTTKTVKVIPNVSSWRCITNSNTFVVVRNMKTNPIYGWKPDEIDPQMMTNMQWGTVTYLSKSIYGVNTLEIWINNNKNYITGCAGNSVAAANTTGCNAYSTTNGVKASTTHNIYGVYDMSGGSWERVSAYVNNGHANLTTYGLNILNADSKYKNIYSMGSSDTRTLNYEANKNVYGDAIYEISNTGNSASGSWFSDYSYTPATSDPWFRRGGYWSDTSASGPFSFYYVDGSAYVNRTFRVVLTVQK